MLFMNQFAKQTLFVAALIHNANQEVLVVRRSLKDHFMPGYLELPGGRVEAAETLEHALHRKLSQDLSLQIAESLYYTSIARLDPKGAYTRAIFELAYNPAMTIRLTNAHHEYSWVSLNALNGQKVTTDTYQVVHNYLGQHKINDDKKTTITVYTDGGSRGNPGPSALGFVIYDGSGRLIAAKGDYIGISNNNVAEYQAVLAALTYLREHGLINAQIELRSDSLLVVNQMNGEYKLSDPELVPLNRQIRQCIKDFNVVRFVHVPRDDNTVADTEVNRVLNAHDESSAIINSSDH